MNDIGQVYCALLVNKSRIVWLKFISVPRLELTGVALSIKKSKILDLKIGYHVFGEVYWTDNQVVLGYINSDFCQCKVFLENRVQQIPDDTSTKQWHYVEICNNPADDPSRGLDSKVKKEIKRWFDGLLFFWDREQFQEKDIRTNTVSGQDPELRKVIKVNDPHIENGIPSNRLEKPSRWEKPEKSDSNSYRNQWNMAKKRWRSIILEAAFPHH